jgi:hypothetical protein
MNGWTFSTPYYLADGIHPDWTCFMTTLSNPVGNKNKLCAKIEESNKKDVAGAFGILQKCFKILFGHSRMWSIEEMTTVIKCCIILHNTIVEIERSLPDSEELIQDILNEHDSNEDN